MVIIVIAFQLINALVNSTDRIDITTVDCLYCGGGEEDVIDPINTIGCVIIKTLEVAAVFLGGLLLVAIGYKFFVAETPEERSYTKQWFLAVLVGLIIVVAALHLANWIANSAGLDPFSLDCPTDEDTIDMAKQVVCLIVRLFQGISALVATAIIILSAISLITSESEEERSKLKKRILYAIIGMLVIILGFYLIQWLVSGVPETLADVISIEEITCGLV